MGTTRYLMLIHARQENFEQVEILSIQLIDKSTELLYNILYYINIGIAQEKVSIVEK